MPRKPIESKVIKQIPKSETGQGVTCKTKSGKVYLISQGSEKKHTLWKEVTGGYEKIASSISPYDLYDQIDWEK